MGGLPIPSELKRECASTSDCEVAGLLLDCCGSAQAVGVSKGTREAAEEAARARVGGSCECLAAATRLDSGQTADAPGDVVVTCEARACATRLAESAGSI